VALGASGPAATPKQIAYLEALLEKAGYSSFRIARRDFGLTQRQGSGKFTRQEASDLIERLVNGDTQPPERDVADEGPGAAQAELLRGMPAQWLADELVRRGWSVGEPSA
jgi:hypothetical protein